MRNSIPYFLIVIILLLSISPQIFSQDKSFSARQATDLLSKNASQLALSADDLKNVIITDAYENRIAGTKMVYIQQTYKGIPVYNVIKSIAFKNEKVVSVAGQFVGKPAALVNAADALPAVAAESAVSAASVSANRPIAQKVSSAVVNKGTNTAEFGTLGVSQENITAKLLWVPSKEGKLLLCWQVKFVPVNSSDYLLINVDATNESVISKDNLTVYDNWDKTVQNGLSTAKTGKNFNNYFAPAYRGVTSANAVTSAGYRVIPYPAANIDESGGTKLITNPWDSAGAGNLATTLGWHNVGTAGYDSTRGNNVWAREDTLGNNGSTKVGGAATSTTPSPALTFDFSFNPAAAPKTPANQSFAITQLFYWNNIMHDITYQYGFDEASGNFQSSNISRGGLGNDYVIADAQDGAGTNNANFSTPNDGSRPRMQMFLWSPDARKTLTVNSPSSLAGFKTAIESGFSTSNKLANKGPVTGDVILYSSSDTLGCSTLAGSPLAGKIALIKRGTCGFTIKVKNAQLAGAIGAIVINTANEVITMGGTDNTITIPAVMVSLSDGNAIKAALATQTVNVTLNKGVALDGDLDNGIIGHEYTHGISNRLTGGPANSSCLVNKEQMGEGWSDYYALMLTTDWATAKVTDGTKPRPVGTYVFGQDPVTGPGIRNYPYSTNKTINPWSYELLADYTSGESHNIGEIWTTVLWDMTWNIIQTDGINKNLYNADATGGNSVALKLVTEGMKLQPCLPGFLDGRDGILKADSILYNGRYSCAIWKAFAGRGMGINAQQGSSNEYTDQVADYIPNTAIVKKSPNKVQASSNEEITYTLTADCKCGPIENYKIIDTLSANVTYVSGGAYNAANRTVTFSIPTLASAQSQSFNLMVKVNNNAYTKPDTLLNETFPADAVPATWIATASSPDLTAKWSASNTRSHTAAYSLKAVDVDTFSTQILTTAKSLTIKGASTLSFWHYFNTEENYDGGVLQILPDSTGKWIDAGKYFTKNGYGAASGSSNWFSGNSGQFIQSLVDLSSFQNKKIKIRFYFTSDQLEGGDGWYIDDIMLKNEAGVYNIGKLFTSNNAFVYSSDTVTMIRDAVLPLVWGSFAAEKQGTSGLLKWTTIQEQNTDKFIIERSTDALHFKAIGEVKANGNSSNPLSYNFTDAAPVNGINYYRIRQTDKDGHYSNSDIRSLNFSGVAGFITITPNPARDKTGITVKGNTKLLQVTLFNSKGQKVAKFSINGEYSQLNLSRYLPGVYYVKITGENVETTKKLVIQ